uniref:Uncharacterized protein n=1 Tax=Opuntia streptacantha TaxID=393608 RepID=A0A7C9AVV6_OPUST
MIQHKQLLTAFLVLLKMCLLSWRRKKMIVQSRKKMITMIPIIIQLLRSHGLTLRSRKNKYMVSLMQEMIMKMQIVQMWNLLKGTSVTLKWKTTQLLLQERRIVGRKALSLTNWWQQMLAHLQTLVNCFCMHNQIHIQKHSTRSTFASICSQK